MRELTIDGRRIAEDEPCYVVAELGHNHGGDVKTACAMIAAAAQAGTSAVKLQKRDLTRCYTYALLSQPYENEHSYGKTYGEHRRALEFNFGQYVSCRAMAQGHHVSFFATAFDEASADFLMRLDVPAIKIASGDLLNTPLLRYVAQFGKPMILSTGGGTFEDIDRAVDTILPMNTNLAVLHCTAAYPVRDFAELNLQVIPQMLLRYPACVIGWSGHDSGIAMSVLAYSLGARIIEKHFTLNRAMKGTDHAFSLEPVGLTKLVRDLNRARQALGDGQKRRYFSEEAPLMKMAKSLVVARDLPQGHVLEFSDLVAKSPAGGLPPYLLDSVVGFALACPLQQDEPLRHEHLTVAHVA